MLRCAAMLIAFLPGAQAQPGMGTPSPTLAWGALTELAQGRGEKGEWRQNDSRYDYVDDATAAYGAGEALHLAWVDQGRKDVLFQTRIKARARAVALNVSRSPATFSWLPRIAVGPAHPQRVYLLWQEIIFSGGSHGGEILFARSDDGGASFAAPLNLSRSRGGDGKGRLDRNTWSNGSHDLAAAPDGSLYAAWTEYDGALWFVRSRDGGASFSQPYKVAGDGQAPARAPSIAAGTNGRVYLAWTVGEDPAAAIRVAQSLDGGATFGAPSQVGGGTGHADAPDLALDRNGALHLVYAERSANAAAYAVRHVRSDEWSDGFGEPRTLSQASGIPGAAYPRIGADGHGGIYVLWEVLSLTDGRPRGQALSWSNDDGRSFTPPRRVPGSGASRAASNGSQQGLLGRKLAVAPNGRLAIVNSSLVPGKGSRVWLVEVRRLGYGQGAAPAR